MAGDGSPSNPGRRKLLTAGGAALVSGTILGRLTQAGATDHEGHDYPTLGSSPIHEDGSAALYGHAHDPPSWMQAGSLDRHTHPPQPRTGDVDLELDVVEERLEVGAGVHFDAWTYGGTVPGPIIRVEAGRRLRVRLRNLTPHSHNLHFHGAHPPEMDGWEPIPSGDEFVYQFEAGPPGVHPYHCHVPPLAEHIARGLYGMLIVDPPGGRPAAHELALMLSGFDDGRGPNSVMAWNGVAGYYHRYPIKVPVGEPVRAYVMNMTEYEPVGSFHLHAQTFGVYPAGMGDAPAFHTDTIGLGQAERAMLEFTLPSLGRYMFHPHQHHLADRGAMGWMAAI